MTMQYSAFDSFSILEKYVTKFWKINHFVTHETIRIFMFNLWT